MSAFDRVLRAGEGRKLRAIKALVADISALEPSVANLDDNQLRGRTEEFRHRLAAGEDLDDLCADAFATVREAAKRSIGLRHYDEQLMGSVALHFGWIAEMATGEGKTLVATAAAYLNALAGRGVHVVTTNDYLASRDAATMGAVYEFLGLTVGCLTSDLTDVESRRSAYTADITYSTNAELGFDYLRDNMVADPALRCGRERFYAIVDEVDSILIDEARTPLIITLPSTTAAGLYRRFAEFVNGLRRGIEYELNDEETQVWILPAGIEATEQAFDVTNLFDPANTELAYHLDCALKAKEIQRRDRNYIVTDGEAHIVDTFTGRVLADRRWSDGVHQAVEAKEGLDIHAEDEVQATVTFQNFFRSYEKLSGMTGTAETEASEFASTYGLSVVEIPTHRPNQRIDHPDVVWRSEKAKFAALVDDIATRSAAGQPVLAGTASVEKSERLSEALTAAGIKHSVLNAKEHHSEALTIAQAGQPGAVTVATNMAGRGVDILLGGNPDLLADAKIAELVAENGEQITAAQEAEIREEVAKDCAAAGSQVRELGGLYVCGTERHESRRIDNQLRGRTARQGDPGESRFWLALDDDLLSQFATENLSRLMSTAVGDDAPLEAKFVNRMVERAQNTVEGRNADIRSEVLKYDDVLNEQRIVAYTLRDRILDGEFSTADFEEVLDDQVDALLERHFDDEHTSSGEGFGDIDALLGDAARFWPVTVDADTLDGADEEQVRVLLRGDARKPLDDAIALLGADFAESVISQLRLAALDRHWVAHLRHIEHLRDGIHLRGLTGTDPIVAWQNETYDLFSEFLAAVDADTVAQFLKATFTVAGEPGDEPDGGGGSGTDDEDTGTN